MKRTPQGQYVELASGDEAFSAFVPAPRASQFSVECPHGLTGP